MTDSTLVFEAHQDTGAEIVVNFGVFSGREATEAELRRLADTLLETYGAVEIVAEQRYEFDREMEAVVHVVRVRLPYSSAQFGTAIEEWARDAIAERAVARP
jgi:hypothetical protein